MRSKRRMTRVWPQVSLVTPSGRDLHKCDCIHLLLKTKFIGQDRKPSSSIRSADLGIDHAFVSDSCNSLSSNTRSTRCFITKRPFRWNTGMSHLYLSNHVLFSGRLMSTSWRTNCRETRQTQREIQEFMFLGHTCNPGKKWQRQTGRQDIFLC